MQLGAQLYTIREHTKTLESFSESLKKIADIGYQIVQVSGTCDYEGAWLEEQLKQNGLSCVVTHSKLSRMEEDLNALIDDHKRFHCQRIGLGSASLNTIEEVNLFIEKFKPITKVMSENSIQFMYHNHGMEFSRVGDEQAVVLDLLCNAFTPAELGVTLDTFWVQYAGGDPVVWLEKLNGRTPCIHLKDMEFVGNKQRTASVGSGNMNFDRILQATVDNHVEYGLVEQDDCYEEDPFVCLKKSYDYLSAKGFK